MMRNAPRGGSMNRLSITSMKKKIRLPKSDASAVAAACRVERNMRSRGLVPSSARSARYGALYSERKK